MGRLLSDAAGDSWTVAFARPGRSNGRRSRRGRTATEAYLNGTAAGSRPDRNEEMRPFQRHEVAGGYGVGVTPVPIPNTVVKPHRANGTAGLSGGRVRRCQLHLKRARPGIVRRRALCFVGRGARPGRPSLGLRLRLNISGGHRTFHRPPQSRLGRAGPAGPGLRPLGPHPCRDQVGRARRASCSNIRSTDQAAIR